MFCGLFLPEIVGCGLRLLLCFDDGSGGLPAESSDEAIDSVSPWVVR
ncbi:hypothetical protein [Treponema vincentii]|nr:hypothetical protein [Treponema vincentii]UTC47894.1 hypothetical protein E4N73_03130 [Treponema vincentii]